MLRLPDVCCRILGLVLNAEVVAGQRAFSNSKSTTAVVLCVHFVRDTTGGGLDPQQVNAGMYLGARPAVH